MKISPLNPGRFVTADSLTYLRSRPENSVDMILGSPPYENARSYEGQRSRVGQEWVDWMYDYAQVCRRICSGLCAFVVQGRTRDFRWSATPVLLMADLHRAGFHLRTPKIYERDGIPGSGGPDDLKQRYEWIICFTSGGRLPWSDPTATGHPPKYPPGGPPSHRTTCTSGYLKGDARTKGRIYTPPNLANPGNILRGSSGGGHMGSKYASEGEAPYPEWLCSKLIKTYCPPAYCTACGFVVDYVYDKEELQTVWEDIHEVRLSDREAEVLFEDLREFRASEATSEMRDLPKTDSVHQRDTEKSILQSNVLGSMDSNESEELSRGVHNDERVQTSTQVETSNVVSAGVCHGTSPRDGGIDWEKLVALGSSASQKRNKGRQSLGKLRVDVGSRSQSASKRREENQGLSLLSRRDNLGTTRICWVCRYTNIRPGIVLDMWSGSGTTVCAAVKCGRLGIGIDVRQSQTDIAQRRYEEEAEP